MNQTAIDLSTLVGVHKLCECEEWSVYHRPHQCKHDGDQTCVKCGRQCCSDCIYADGLCVTCSSKERSA